MATPGYIPLTGPVFVLNGHRNAAHEVQILNVTEDTIVVFNPAKNQRQEFSRFTLEPKDADPERFKGNLPRLVRADHPIVVELNRIQQHIAQAEELHEFIERYKREPSDEAFTSIVRALSTWHATAPEVAGIMAMRAAGVARKLEDD